MRISLTTSDPACCTVCNMAKMSRAKAKSAPTKQPNRPHHIEEWAKVRGFTQQTSLAEALNVDKSLVSRWYGGASPTERYQEKLVATLKLKNREQLFRGPDEDWVLSIFRERSAEEKTTIRAMIEAVFPTKPSNP